MIVQDRPRSRIGRQLGNGFIMEDNFTPVPVLNGLKLKEKNQELPFCAFHYVPLIRYPHNLLPIDWHPLSLYITVGEHIRIHELKEGDDLLACIELYRDNHAKAVIVVNTSEDSSLPVDLTQSLTDALRNSFLVAVLPSSEGSALIDCLQVQFEDDELYAKLDLVNSESTQLTVLGLGEDDQKAVLPGTTSWLGKFFGGRSNVYDLNGEIKKIMFDNGIMKPITLDAGLFTMIMTIFSTFEEFGKSDTTPVNELLRSFHPYLESSFHLEFPFYLIVVYRLRKFRSLYDCEELDPFITRCIDMFEILPAHQVTQTLLNFLDKKDFDIMFGSDQGANSSVFTLLATAARNLMGLSLQVKRSNKHSTASSKRIIYCRLLWISVFLKCLSEKDIVTRMDVAIWDKEFILKIPKKISITEDMIDDFKLGLELSKLLKLPIENQFTNHHLGCFLADEKSVRPFAYARDVVIRLEEFITSDKELLVHILINLRVIYTELLKASDPTVVGRASIDGTLLGTVDEGISFLDSMTKLWVRKGWHIGEQHGDFRAECLKWMMLLLGAVRVDDPNAPQLLKKFLAPKTGSIIANREYRTEIVQFILEDTRAKFPDLTIQQFFSLFRSFRIWAVPFLCEYLMQYRIPANVNIADPLWSEFFVEVLNRYADADNYDKIRKCIMDFIIKVAEKYHKAQKSCDFIPDVLQLHIASLFAPTSEDCDNIENRFTNFLQDYIRRNTLRPIILERIQEILAQISEDKQTLYHGIVLNILQQEVMPELKSLQDESFKTTKLFKNLLKFSVNTACQKISWFGVLSPRQQFCWGVISAGCSKIPISAESFEWLISLQPVISQLGSIFNSYCNSRQLLGHTCLLTESLPQEVVECQWDDVRNYFNWIRQAQDILGIWQNKFLKNNVNFDEILTYANHNVAISSLGRAVRASDYLMDLQYIQGVKESFMVCFEQLNCYLIKYIRNHPESTYCTLVELLLCYGVHFPPKLQQKFQGKVIFPGNDRDIPDGQKLNNVINASVRGQFEPGQDVSLMVTKSCSLYDLQRILEDLQTFLELILDQMDMLVFFHLEKSDIFSKHFHKRLNDLIITTAASPKVERTFTTLPSFKPSIGLSEHNKAKAEGVSMAILQKGLNGVKDLLLKVLRGTVTYSDIVAEGTLILHELKIEKEIGKLKRFSEQLEMSQDNCEGLEGMRSMLELFQFTHHIEQIRQVCEQFKLTKCLQDDQFKYLLEIVEEFETDESRRSHLTPLEASHLKKMGIIKKILCLKEHTNNHSCLELFPAVLNSVPFYQFIKDKQFVGHKGQTLFREQYQLVTAQLQHEEYDENVLNHLRAAFEFIAPFTESDIAFSDLMKKVTKLDTTNVLKQLETVIDNITMIIAWFSRAEGDTDENEFANVLQHILSTGVYQFQLLSNSCNVQLIYQTVQAIRTHKRACSDLAQPLKDSGELISNKSKQDVTFPTVYPSPVPPSLEGKKKDPFGNIMGVVEQIWSIEQIADFVRKLGFLDSCKEGGDDIKKFLHLNSTANRMMELFMKLHKLGHPKYQSDRNLPTLLCTISGVEADKKVAEFEQTLVQWQNQVDALHQKYTWLLFLSVPKALCLYSLINDLDIGYDAITREISFLFENTSNVRAKLRTVVKSVIDNMFTKMGESTPMEFLGKLLQLVCCDSTLAPHLLKQRCSDTTRMTSMSVKLSRLSITSPAASGHGTVGMFHLHYAPGYTQEQILRLITLIYKGVPECFEVLQCSPTTTTEELSMFMKRVRYHPLPYLVLLVNRLPYKLQQQLSLLMKNVSQIPEDIGFGRGVGVVPTVHFIETSPSILREMPFVTYHEHKEDDPGLSFDEASRLCQRKIFQPTDFSGIKLVYGYPGDGKTHYIRRQLSKCPATLCVSVNEAFTPLNTINSLNSLPHTAPEIAIFFNFTINPCLDAKQNHEEHRKMLELMDSIGWFFYHLLVLGYIEDAATGTSYCLPGGQSLAIYIEVPSQDRKHNIDDCLRLCNQYIPVLGLLGTPYKIHQSIPYCIDEEVQLVCKYLRAYDIGGVKGIDRLYREGYHLFGSTIIKFSNEDDLPDEECHRLLRKYMPPHVQETKIKQKLFIKYMKRRCDFLENNPAFNYNTGVGKVFINEKGQNVVTDSRQLGSTIMRTMLEEVSNFCDPAIKQNWTSKPCQQLIYDGSGSFGLLSLQPDAMPDRRREQYTKIGFKIHSSRELQQRNVLDKLLSRALNLPFHEDQPLSIIDDCNYVLTLDYTVKMLNIHERYSCGVPVIIKGETGVGKTALVDMLSQLWNTALLNLWNNERSKIVDAIRDLVNIQVEDPLDNYQMLLKIVEAITAGRDVSISDLIMLGQVNDREPIKGKFHNRLRAILMDMERDPTIALLRTPTGEKGHYGPLQSYFEDAKRDGSVNGIARLLHAVLQAKIKTTFHKLNVDASLAPKEIKEFFKPIFEQALVLKKSYENANASKKAKLNKMPFVTVFLDEVNTSSCLGLFKEIIVDKTLDGETIPENVFIVAACNPHRVSNLATRTAETWIYPSYYVRPLHPTLDYLTWNYGALDQYQERDYISAMMRMLQKDLASIEVITLCDLIVESQSLMRRYALRQLTSQKMDEEEAKMSSRSCVSQRDIQRVFTFYQWLMDVYSKLKHHGSNEKKYSHRAVMVSLGIVYYMRLNDQYRKMYEEVLDKKVKIQGEVNFSQAFREELDYFCMNIELPSGIARTRALKENLFATIVCTVTHTPLVIVGAPGSSKTLSFNLAIANLKGPESKRKLYRNLKIFKSLHPHYYQCSSHTTSNEIQNVFYRAISRQRSHMRFSLPIYCVVLIDNAVLPEESHKSLKVLHYHLDKQEVSFVAITDHVLDAAKTNRAVTLFRPEFAEEDLKSLAKGCLCPNPDQPPANLIQDLKTIVNFCPAYSRLMDNPRMKRFFGLRDFIHFINYLRRRRTTAGITHQLVMEALERNFSGIYWSNRLDEFENICRSFLCRMPTDATKVKWRSILEVLKESLADHPKGSRGENEIRYKLVIDPTDDNSLVCLLIRFGIVNRDNTRIYMCSDFPGGSHIQKMNTITAIRHSAIKGHTVIMSQTDDIHESFYDLFNQRFHRIDDPEHGPHYYANIAIGAHLRPCKIHPDFACIVVIKQSKIKDTPAPFLNRFEKYCISHKTLLSTALDHLKPCIRTILQKALEKVNEFISILGRDNSTIYGLRSETLDSLLLSLLPTYGYEYKPTPPEDPISDSPMICLLHELLRALKNSAGFAIPACPVSELKMDAQHIIFFDVSFEVAFDMLSVVTANSVVNKAFQLLHSVPDSNSEGELPQETSQEVCLVVSVLQQWLIRHLCKSLMQLMTPEALCLHRKKIPASLIDNYLTNQHHFSLKHLLDSHLGALQQSTDNDSYHSQNKLLCFTRSTSIIHHLPSNNSKSRFSNSSTDEVLRLKELVHDDLDAIEVCQIISIQSQTAVQEMLRDFTNGTRKMLLLIANMQEATIKLVNHLRMLIEEAEFQAPTNSKKLYILLLHFPPAMFFDSCYPSLFLRGWNHYYLDTIGQCPTLHPGQLDIEEWLQRCYFPTKKFEEDNLMIACNHLLDTAIPTLTSHVVYGTRSTGPFTREMNESERQVKLKSLLWDKGVGLKLCQMFRAAWTPPVMMDYLEQAAKFTQTRESSLNITDAVQTMFQSVFTDFMVYMVTNINMDHNLDVLFSDAHSTLLEELFVSLMDCINPPKLAQLKTLVGSLTPPKPQKYQPSFPFFKMVFKSMEQLIEDSRKVKGNQRDLFQEQLKDTPPSINESLGPDQEMMNLAELVMSTINNRMKEPAQSGLSLMNHPVFISLRYIQSDQESIWNCYFTDLIYHTLHVDMTASPLSREIITVYFTDLLTLSPLERFVYLHVYMQCNQFNLGNLRSLLRPLEKIWKVAAESPHSLTTSRSSLANDFIEAIKKTNAPFGDPVTLSTFVISALFSGIVGLIFPQESQALSKFKSDALQLWYRTYQMVMLSMALRLHLYTTPIPDCEVAKFNVMHTTYSVICAYPAIDEKFLMKGHNLFELLLEKYFKQSLQLKNAKVVPTLEECLTLANKMVQETEDQSRILHESLFEHFLSHKRGVVSLVDRQYFLLLANDQYGWKASAQLVKEITISSSYSEDRSKAVKMSDKPKMRFNQQITTSSSMAVYKKYLSLLLGNYIHSDEEIGTMANPLEMYNKEVRQSIAETLANGVDSIEDTCPYIPFFYQNCRVIKASKHSESLIMQQPLCHLYFITLLEHLMDKPCDVNALIRLVGTITQLAHPQSVPPGEKIVLQIEKQAIIQCLLRQLALLLCGNTNQSLMAKELKPVLTELNDILEDDGTGGGNIGGHRLTLGMHLLQKLKSYRYFMDMFNGSYPIFKEVKCLSVFHEQLRACPKGKPYLLPFMQAEDQSTLSQLYHQVKAAMLKVHESKGSRADANQFLKVAEDCFNARSKLMEKIDKKQAFKMMVWLVAYYEFFVRKKSSQALCQMVGAGLKRYINDDCIIRLIQCFLNTRWFTKLKESPYPLRDDEILKILRDGTAIKVDHRQEKVDPLYNLFTAPNKDEELCHCLANLVGVTLGCQPKSTHLWYHLFSPAELKDTYMTGFMYNAKISSEGLLYDCGVELTPDGQYGRPDYQPHATRGTYSLHSLYFLLWANFGTFCISMLTLPESQSKLHGSIISDWQAIRHYCVSQVKTLWINLRDNLNLFDEERSFLVTRCLMNLYESNSEVSGAMLGKLETREELDRYEIFWHQKIFSPARQELDKKFDLYSFIWMDKLLLNLRTLEAYYPLHPSEKDFLNYINGLKLEDTSSRLLSKFAVEKQRLEVGGELLPSLIQLYQWLHNRLSYLVTTKRAYKLTIGQVIKIASRRVDPELHDLYIMVKGLYNKYVELVGGAIGQEAYAAVRRGNKIYVIDDDLPLIHFLTGSEEGSDNDWLYAVIKDIAETQNLFIHSLYANVGNVEMNHHPLARLLAPEPASIFLAEANDFTSIVGNQRKIREISPFLSLIRARVTDKSLPRPSLSFNLAHLQEDIIACYFAGKPVIEDIYSLRTPFKFKEDMSAANRGPIDLTADESQVHYLHVHDELPGKEEDLELVCTHVSEEQQLKEFIAEQQLKIAALEDAVANEKQVMSQENQALIEIIEELKFNSLQGQKKFQDEKENYQKLMIRFLNLEAEHERCVKAHLNEIEELRSNHQQEKRNIEKRNAALLLQQEQTNEEVKTLMEENHSLRQRLAQESEEHSETKTALEELRRHSQQRDDDHKKMVDELENKIIQFERNWKIGNDEIRVTNKKLGKGGYGKVFVGVFKEQKVAVKQLHDLIVGENTLAIMHREINTMSRLHHPNLLLFIGAVLDHPSRNPLIITEIMDTSLRQAYEKGQLTEEISTLSILRDTASGLNYLHCHYDEIIHRDVSSANVLLESRGTNKWRAKLSDFGSANIARNAFTQAPGAQVYSAPEALVAIASIDPKPQTTKMDVYSYGILACEVMSSQFPDSPAVFRTMLARVRTNSPSIARMVQECINESPDNRPTMRLIITQLDRLLL